MYSPFMEELQGYMSQCGYTVSEKQLQQFELFYHRLIEKNKVMNLTGITDPKEVMIKHFIDSLFVFDEKLFTTGTQVLDLGTGAGFPGIPLAIYLPHVEFVLFDSLQKRLGFLEEVKEELGLTNIRMLHGRAEDVDHDALHREAYDIVTSRAVARLPVLLEWGLPFVKQGGMCLAMKGAAYEAECMESKKALAVLGGDVVRCKRVELPTIEDIRAIVYIEKIKKTPKQYPRKPRIIKINSL